MIVLSCDDFIKSGIIKAESCCPYCHENETLYFSEDYVIDNNNVKAVLCCVAAIKISNLGVECWNTVLKGKQE